MISLKGFSEDIEPYPDCFQYEGGLQKRGNVKDATRAFDLLLNGEYEEKDDIVSSSF